MYGAPVGTILVSGTGISQYLIQTTNSTTGAVTNDPVRIFHVTLTTNGVAPNLSIANGQGGTAILISGTSFTSGNRVLEVDYGFHGHTFPAGAYISGDTNVATAAIICRADQY